VSITGTGEGQEIALCELFGGQLALTTDAPSLAHQTGARLLPVFTVREDADGPIVVQIGSPIEANSPDRDRAIEQAVRAFVNEIEWTIRRYPDQWLGWDAWDPHAYPLASVSARQSPAVTSSSRRRGPG
jgi:lauroyl/myristoyl acyltransferase